MSAGDIQPRCFDTRRMRGLSRERDVLETIARETEKLIHVDEGREKSNEKKKGSERNGRWDDDQEPCVVRKAR